MFVFCINNGEGAGMTISLRNGIFAMNNQTTNWNDVLMRANKKPRRKPKEAPTATGTSLGTKAQIPILNTPSRPLLYSMAATLLSKISTPNNQQRGTAPHPVLYTSLPRIVQGAADADRPRAEAAAGPRAEAASSSFSDEIEVLLC
jgi:hypothetical protein